MATGSGDKLNNRSRLDTGDGTGSSSRSSHSSSKNDLWQRATRECEQPQKDYRKTLDQKGHRTDNKISNTSLEDVKNENIAGSTRDASAATSTEQVASQQSRRWGHLLKTAFLTALVATGGLQEVHANTTSLSVGDGHGTTTLNPTGDLERRFMLRGVTNRPDYLQENMDNPLIGRKLLLWGGKKRAKQKKRVGLLDRIWDEERTLGDTYHRRSIRIRPRLGWPFVRNKKKNVKKRSVWDEL
jgi:hypothetical protein